MIPQTPCHLCPHDGPQSPTLLPPLVGVLALDHDVVGVDARLLVAPVAGLLAVEQSLDLGVSGQR